MGLTIKQIARLSKPGRYHHEHGLYLQVSRSGTKSWLFRYQHGKREHMMGLGPLRLVPLKGAEEKVKRLSVQLLDGTDPLAAKRAARALAGGDASARKTFNECLTLYLAKHEAEWRSEKHRQQWVTSLATYAGPEIGERQVSEICKSDVLRVLDPIWSTKTVTAGRVRGRIEKVLAFAKSRGYREGDNPAAWEVLEHELPAPAKIAEKKHHAALPFKEMPDFYAALAERPGIAAKALAFTILCAARTGEVTGAVWSEIDLDAATWEIPASRMKMKKLHRVPLVPAAVELLKALPREEGNPHVFIAPSKGKGLSSAAMAALLQKRMGRSETVHGFRASFSTWCGDETSFKTHITEACLAHDRKSETESAYNRGDLFKKRREIMQAWASFCTSPTADAKILPLKAKGVA